MEVAVPLQALDGDDLFAFHRGRLRQTGAHGPPANQDGAGAALPLATAVFRAGQIELVAQHAEQRAFSVNLDAAPGSVDLKFQDSHSSSESAQVVMTLVLTTCGAFIVSVVARRDMNDFFPIFFPRYLSRRTRENTEYDENILSGLCL